MDFFDLLHRRGVDDAAAVQRAQQLDEPPPLVAVVRRPHHLEPQVRTEDAGVDDVRVAQPQRSRDVFDHSGRRGCGQREDGRVPQSFDRGLQREVRRPEIVSPLRHAVRFVDHDDVDRVPADRVDELRVVRETLRRRQHELRAPLADRLERCGRLTAAERAVHLRGVDSRLRQLVGLILHQRDERRDDERRSFQVQSRQLVTERLAAACRHDGKRVAPTEYGPDDILLSRAERANAEHVPHRPLELTARDIHGPRASNDRARNYKAARRAARNRRSPSFVASSSARS